MEMRRILLPEAMESAWVHPDMNPIPWTLSTTPHPVQHGGLHRHLPGVHELSDLCFMCSFKKYIL
jgi:hypothetical protein